MAVLVRGGWRLIPHRGVVLNGSVQAQAARHLDRLPDGGFVVAASRARRYENADQVQGFDALGREASSFSVGDAIEHMLVDEAGHIWVGHFDENPAGIRRWSPTGHIYWASDGASIPGLFDCYALNVSGTTAWACTYTDFPLVEIRPGRPDRPVRVWPNQVRGATAVAVYGERVAFYGGYGEEVDRLTCGVLTEAAVEPTDVGLLTPADGTCQAAAGSSAGGAGFTSRPSRSPCGACSTSAAEPPKELPHRVSARIQTAFNAQVPGALPRRSL
ncbi:hypothetical protein [Streptomyces sp. NPDC001665]